MATIPDLPATPPDSARLQAEIERLNKVVQVLINRAERSTYLQGSDFNLFQTTLMLEEQVEARTAELQAALAENEKINRALLQAKQVLEQTQARQQRLIDELEAAQIHLRQSESELRQHRDHLSEMVAEQTADLIRAKETAERASALKSEFLANMSHEFRTPLHAIVSFAQMGIDRADRVGTDKLKDYFMRINQSGVRMTGLVNNLLDLTKLETRHTQVETRSSDVLAIIADVEYALGAPLEARKLTVTHTLHCTDTCAQVDPEQFYQVLVNLYANAIKYSPADSGIELVLSDASLIATDGQACPALRISIHDQGPGIPPGEEEMIFDKFVQSSRTKTGAGGVGLGLAIAREIVGLHGGKIQAGNNPHCGAVFEIILPR